MPGERPQEIFSVIRADYGVDTLYKARKLVKDSSCITKQYCSLQFNHNCLRSEILPNSFKFFPPIRTPRRFRLARKHDFEFLKLRITECHVTIKENKSSCNNLVSVVESNLTSETF